MHNKHSYSPYATTLLKQASQSAFRFNSSSKHRCFKTNHVILEPLGFHGAAAVVFLTVRNRQGEYGNYLGGAQSCLVQSSRVPTYVLFLQVTLTTSTPVNHSRGRDRTVRTTGNAPGPGIKRSERREAQSHFKRTLLCVAGRNLGDVHKCTRLIGILMITEFQKHGCECFTEPLFTSAADIHLISACT